MKLLLQIKHSINERDKDTNLPAMRMVLLSKKINFLHKIFSNRLH